MAKKPTAPKINVSLLAAIAAGSVAYISQADGLPLLQNAPALIEVNTTVTDPSDPSKAAVRLTAEGQAMVVAAANQPVQMAATTSPYAIIKNAALPASKRGNKGGGAPTQYPFETMEVGDTFFVPVSEKHPNPVKSLGSTVSSANAKFAVPTGDTKVVSRTKRGKGNRAIVDAAGNKVKEDVTVQVKKPAKKFSIRPVVKGTVYGGWTADADGALIGRTI